MRGAVWLACLCLCTSVSNATYVAINSGGPAYQQNTSGTFGAAPPPLANSTLPGSLVFQADHFFTGVDTRVNNDSAQAVANTSDPALYWSDREGTLVVYSVNIPAGIYSVSLYFAELDPVFQGTGLRTFDVLLQGQLVRPNSDCATS